MQAKGTDLNVAKKTYLPEVNDHSYLTLPLNSPGLQNQHIQIPLVGRFRHLRLSEGEHLLFLVLRKNS